MKAGQMKTPPNAKIETAPSGRKYYISGIDAQTNEAIIRYVDGECEFKRVALKYVGIKLF